MSDPQTVDPFTVAPNVRAIEDAIVDLLGEIEDFEDVSRGLVVDPQGAPSATVAVEFFVKGAESTGRVVDYGWRFTITLAFDYTKKDAYDTYFVVLHTVIKKFQANPTLNESCYQHTMRDRGVATPYPGRGLLIKTVEVVAEVEEEDDGF